ncbi:MAG: Coenzyme F420 hydrogenase/dehydrogenase, beta subunit C-terminal domain [Chlorobium sp.]|nr:Coenzyme F420 hydrogenase/dehydrogenase, beta subunit C-terminal domain [Chlorobium sp.]
MGCGACQWACPNNAISLCDIVDKGIRPVIDETLCKKCGKCVEVCPGVKLVHEEFPNECITELSTTWGPILQIQEGFATDKEIRFKGSSGGVATALALWALENGGFAGVLHIKVDPNDPIRNIPTFSRTRADLMQTVGSRYAPAAPCQAFNQIKQAEGSCVFIGKPCDCAALRNACRMDEKLAANVGLVVSIFCAGTPTTAGTLSILRALNILNPTEITSFRYRGHGWPGAATAEVVDLKPANRMNAECRQYSMSYAEAWGNILSKYGQLRCRLCPDKTGEFADISLGDPWYRETQEDSGRSLILIRSRIGEKIWEVLQNQSYLEVEPSIWSRLPDSQKSIHQGRSVLWGRILVMKIWRIPFPILTGFNLIYNWGNVSTKQKMKTLLGTLRRIIQRNWARPLD